LLSLAQSRWLAFSYGGDALASGEAGMSIFDFSAFYEKRMIDYTDSQGATTDGSLQRQLRLVRSVDMMQWGAPAATACFGV